VNTQIRRQHEHTSIPELYGKRCAEFKAVLRESDRHYGPMFLKFSGVWHWSRRPRGSYLNQGYTMTESNNMPSRLGARWTSIANELGLQVIAPALISLPSGIHIKADALLSDFGGQRGMLLLTDDELVWPHRTAIVAAGYGFSILDDPDHGADSEPNFHDIIDVLRDWGWTGDAENQPAWL